MVTVMLGLLLGVVIVGAVAAITRSPAVKRDKELERERDKEV